MTCLENLSFKFDYCIKIYKIVLINKNEVRNHLLIFDNSKAFSNHYKFDSNLNIFKIFIVYSVIGFFAGLFFTLGLIFCHLM